MNLKHMNKGLVLWAVMLALVPAASPGAAVEELRSFTDLQGRTFKGQVTDYNASNQVVTVTREDGKSGALPLDRFSEEDRLYIRQWWEHDAFLSKLKIVPQLMSKDVTSEASATAGMMKQVVESWYDIKVVNRSEKVLEKVELEYCLYYRQGERKGYTINYDEGISYSKEQLAPLAPSAETVIKSKSIRLYSEGGQQTIFGKVDFSDADVRGIWLRLTMRLPGGEVLVRDYRTSDDTFWKWTPQSIGVGLNKGDTPKRTYMLLPQ